MRLFSSAACSAGGPPTCATLMSAFGSRPPLAASQRATVSWVPPIAETPTIAPFNAASRLANGSACLDAGTIEEGGGDHKLRRDFRHQRIDDFERLPLGCRAKHGLRSD